MKKDERPKDFTVLMLLTVSEIREPMNFYDLYDLVAILLVTETWMKLTKNRKGAPASDNSPIFQQLTKATIREQTTATELRDTTAITPVIIL